MEQQQFAREPAASVRDLKDKIFSVSDFVFTHPELGSEEFECSKMLEEILESEGFIVERNFMEMKTAFIAKYGRGEPTVAVFAEYDALPIGHGCGHNLIAAWAFGVGSALKRNNFRGTILVIGSPAEEGNGPYANSKAIMAPKLKDMGVNSVFTMHPRFEWEVGGPSLSISSHAFVFKGVASHAAAAPEFGRNALDAAVLFYTSFRFLRTLVRRDMDVVLSAIIKEGGTAANVIPDRAEVWADVRTNDPDYIQELNKLVIERAKSAAQMESCTVEHTMIGPTVLSKKRWPELDTIVYNSAIKYVGETISPEVSWSRSGKRGSTDVGNVSQILPTVHLGIKMCPVGTPSHSVQWREASGSRYAKEALLFGVSMAVDAIEEFSRSRG